MILRQTRARPHSEIHPSLDGSTRHVGRARCNRARGKETVLFAFEHDDLRLALALP